MKKTLDLVLYIFIALAIAFSLVSLSLITVRSEKVKESLLLAEKENQPAKLELIKIAASSCKDCFDVDPVIESLKKSNANVTERTLEFSSAEAKQLISQYSIGKLPTVIVLGEVNKSSVANLWNQEWKVGMENGTQVSSVYAAVSPPYVDASGNIKGMVILTHIVDQSCPNCTNLTQLIGFLKQSNVRFTEEKTIDYASPEAKDLISRFGIQKVPAIVISKDILDYPPVAQVWDQLNATEKQGFYPLHTLAPPYRNLETGKIEGLVTVIYLRDDTCTSCYDVKLNKLILERTFGLMIVNETEADVSSDYGKSLLKQYNMTKVPVILVSSDAAMYSGFPVVWPQVGNIASDGWHVMRNPEVLGTYKDLSSGQVISPPQPEGG